MSESVNQTNDNLVLISGMSTTGKSASLRSIKNPERVMYLNAEHKKLPFRSKFQEFMITDPFQVYEAFDYAAGEGKDKFDTIVLDSFSFLMDMFETKYIIDNPPLTKSGQPDTMAGWGNYASYGRRLFNEYSAKSPQNRIFLAHNKEFQTKEDSFVVKETKVAVKGSLNDKGIEAYFSVCINTKRMPVDELREYENDMLHITPEEEALGYKYVFQTILTKDTISERIRSPMGMWSHNETFIDNNVQYVIDRLNSYYND